MGAVDLTLPVGEPAADPRPSAALKRLAAAVAAGNRCGHDPSCPRWFAAPAEHAVRPKILVQLQERVRTYFANPAVLPSLNAANSSPRRQRSERREGCLALLGALVHYLDLVTLRVGVPQTDGGFKGLPLDYLAARAGLGLRRAERACRDLVTAGLLHVYPRAEKTAADRHRGLPAVRRLPEALFAVFGLGQWLRHERDKAARRQRRQRRQQDAAEAARYELALAAVQHPVEAARPVAADLPARRAAARTALAALRNLLKGRPPP